LITSLPDSQIDPHTVFHTTADQK